MAAAVFFAALGCPQEASAEEPPLAAYPEYASYRDVPGVGEDEIAAVESLKSRRGSFVYAVSLSPEAFYGSDGAIEGFSAMFCSWLTGLFGISFEPAVFSWDGLAEGMESYEIDFTGELAPERLKGRVPRRMDQDPGAAWASGYISTGPIAERAVRVTRPAGPAREATEEEPLRYGFLSGGAVYAAVAPYIEEGFEGSFIYSLEEAFAMLMDGRLDAFFDDGASELAFGAYKGLDVKAFSPAVYVPAALSAKDPELAPVISIVHKALDGDGKRRLAEMHSEGRRQYVSHKFEGGLSQAEQQYIKSRRYRKAPIPFIARGDSYPVSYYDEAAAEWRGTVFDVLAEIEAITGLRFKQINSEADKWHELGRMLDEGDVSFMSEADRAADRYILAERPHYRDRYALLSLSGHPDVGAGEVLAAKVGIVEGSAGEGAFGRWFPGHEGTVQYSLYEEAFDALESGEIELLMATEGRLLEAVDHMGRRGLKASMAFDGADSPTFCFNENEEILCSIMGKALEYVDIDGIAGRWAGNAFDYAPKVAEAGALWAYCAALLLCLLAAFLLAAIIMRRKASKHFEGAVAERSKALEDKARTAAQASRRAQAASQAKGEFLARAAQEINAHLCAIDGLTAMEEGDGAAGSARFGEIRRASARLEEILCNVIDMSDIESGKFALKEEPFVLLDAMKEIEAAADVRCEEGKVLFAADFSGLAGQKVIGDRERLKQVLGNLLMNAVKFTPEGGRIDFTLNVDKESEDSLTVTFSVADSGIGISKPQMAKLFVAFESADPYAQDGTGGAGLGLALSQEIVRRMGGDIVARSTPGAGSVFDFALAMPKTRPGGGAPAGGMGIKPPMLAGKRILIVEDIEINRLIMIELLKDTQAEVDEAENGEKAITRFMDSPEGHYSLIFIDTQMPGIDGYETVRRIRRLWRADARSVPIIAMGPRMEGMDGGEGTGEDGGEGTGVDGGEGIGVDGYIAKPIEIAPVMDILRETLAPGAKP
ncbi:MAG: response regulator [Clostridiales Family XIII bacterium]|jgi:signal transduction histidine kinase|nr:response regulator [Clostridiales Family XIII bacterium]